MSKSKKRDKRREAYKDHKKHARGRLIPFLITFEEWVVWWESSLGPDWFKKRGPAKDQYVMARNGDVGPYKLGNITCILSGENIRDSFFNGRNRAKVILTKEQIIEIYQSEGTLKEIGERYGVGWRRVCQIQNGTYWRSITAHLPPNPKRRWEKKTRWSKPDANGVRHLISDV